ncbi:MAG: acyl-CoA mutase large subunit family protein [Ignavibacteriae bacterium]|nr:acyl-CoA mutase large subunit family protein [Ignavibacteriota bacterium]
MSDEIKLISKLDLSKEFHSPTFEEWKTNVEQELKGASYDKKMFTKTYEGIELKPIYTNEDLQKLNFVDSLPGYENFVRGKNKSGYFEKSWKVNQEINIADAEEYNLALIDALKNGQNCINISLDSATKLGIDADYSEEKNVGDSGLSISAIKSVERLFKNIDVTKFSFSIHTGIILLPFLSLIKSYFDLKNIDVKLLKGAISADPIYEFVQTGKLNYDENFIFNSMKLSIDWAEKNSPNLKVIGINTLPFANSGANSVQEISIALSVLTYYTNKLIELGLTPEVIFNKVQFTFGISTNYFMEISKFRAIRILLNNFVNAYGIDSSKFEFEINAKNTTFYHTGLDPYVNLLRTTTQTFSAILGGVDGITSSPFDKTSRTPDNFSRRIARNTQTVLREESHLDQVIDPAGGSYFIESLTEEIAKNAWEYFKKIENEGGILESLKNNFIQNEIEKVYEERSKDINKRKAVIVGTNMYANINEKPLEKIVIDKSEFHKKRSEYLKKFRLNGTNEKHDIVMKKLNSISNNPEIELINIMSEAYLHGATIGEITSALTSSNKNEIRINPLKQKRASEDFENIRELSRNYKIKNGFLPNVFLANMGTIKDYKARADFSKGFFEIGGFEVFDPPGYTDIENLINDVLDSGTLIVTICSTDDKYPELVPQITKAIKSKNENIQIILAGYPKEQIEQHKKSGVDDFIFLGADAMKILTSLYNKIGGQI